MMRTEKILTVVASLLAVSQAGLLLALKPSAKDPAPPAPAEHQAFFARSDFYEAAYGGTAAAPRLEPVYGGIVPHHLFVKERIASFFEGLAGQPYETVILIGPNHFQQGGRILASAGTWQTPYGPLAADKTLIDEMGLAVDEAPFAKEHAISGLVGFIKKSLPEARLVPIILRSETKAEEASALARKIRSAVDPDKTLVLASVDFSHYQPVAVADFHDQASRAVIESFDLPRVYGLEVDSPPSIYAVLAYLETVPAGKARLVAATNSGRLSPAGADNTTSHNFYYFQSGAIKRERSLSALFFGDLMLDRNVGARLKNIGLDGLLGPLAGEEGRFLRGTDVVSANLEGAVTDSGAHYAPVQAYDFAFDPALIGQLKRYRFNFFNLANNHLTDQGQRGVKETRQNLDKLGLAYAGCADREVAGCSSRLMRFGSTTAAQLGFSMVYGDFDLAAAKAKVAEAKKGSDFVVVNVHWGSEYTHQFSKKQQSVGHALVDAGADAVIGHHPHVVQGVEVYKGKPIFYSLGNFVFDQYFSRDTQEGLAVGLFMERGTTTAHIFPLKQKGSVPELMKGKEKEEFLMQLGEWSVGNEAKKQILSGLIETK